MANSLSRVWTIWRRMIVQKLQANLDDVRSELLPADTSTASLDLLAKLGVEMVYVDTEQRAAAEVQRICRSSRMLGLDIETAPLPKFLPKAWPIAVTKDGRRSKLQATDGYVACTRSLSGRDPPAPSRRRDRLPEWWCSSSTCDTFR